MFYNRNLLFSLFILFSLFSLVGYVSADGAPVSDYNIYDENLGTTITLTENITISQGTAYNLETTAGDDNFVIIDCADYNVNITDGAFLYTNNKDLNRVDLNNCNFTLNVGVTFANIISDTNANLNYVTLINSDINSNGNTFHNGSTIQDDYLKFIFDNTNADNLIFDDLNLLITTFSDEGDDFGDVFIYLTNNTNVNYIDFNNSYIDNNGGTFIVVDNLTSDLLDINYSGLNMVRQQEQLLLCDANISTVKITDYQRSFLSNMSNLVTIVSSDINTINVFNSDLNMGCSAVFGWYGVTDATLDINLYGTTIDKQGTSCPGNENIFSFVPYVGLISYDYFSISDLNVDADYNLFYFAGTTIGEFELYNSDLNIASFVDVNSDSNIQSGAIYNNRILTNWLNDMPVYADAGRFNVDFNTDLNTNDYASRQLWLDDDSNATGGNLWLDENGNNAYITDGGLDDDEPNGIGDSNYYWDTSSGFIYDYLPLVAYSTSVDLIPVNVDADFYIYSDANIIYCDINNIGGANATSDYNVLLYIANNFQNNSLVSTDLLAGTQNTVSFVIGAPPSAGDYDFNCVVDYLGTDNNINNDNYFETLTFTAASTYVLELTDANLGTTITLTDNISSFDNNYFILNFTDPNAGDNNYVIIDCNDYNVSVNSGNGIFFNTNGFDINRVDFNNCNFNINAIDSLFTMDSDVNIISYYNSDINLIPSNISCFFNQTASQDNYLKINLDNVDANYLLFCGLDLNISNFVTDNPGGPLAAESVISIRNDSDLNYVNFIDSAIRITKGYIFTLFTLTDSSLIIDANDLNIFAPSSMDTTEFINMVDANYDELTLQNLNPYELLSSMSIFDVLVCDINNINLFDSSLILYGQVVSFVGQSGSTDINLFDSSFTRVGAMDDGLIGLFPVEGGMPITNNSFINLSIYNLDVNTDRNVFVFDDSNVLNFEVIDSNLNAYSLVDLDTNSYVLGGTIYNNVIYVDNINPYYIYAGIGNFNVDLNTILGQDVSIRTKLLTSDDTNNYGGNLWLSLNGDNACNTDVFSPLGICDSPLLIPGSDENYYDNLPLIAYTASADLIGYNIILPKTEFNLGETSDVNFIYGNIGLADATSDYNLLLTFCADSNHDDCSPTLSNDLITSDLLADQNSFLDTEVIFDDSGILDMNLVWKATIIYPGDNNNDNDYVFSEVFTIIDPAIDLNLGETYTIPLSVNGWLANLFKITTTDDDNFVTIRCDPGVVIDTNSSSYDFLFIDANIQTINIEDCNFNIDINGFLLIEGKAPEINFINSYVYVSSEAVTSSFIELDYATAMNTLDINFADSFINSESKFGFRFQYSDVNYFTVTDLNYIANTNQKSNLFYITNSEILELKLINSYYEYNRLSGISDDVLFYENYYFGQQVDLNFYNSELIFNLIPNLDFNIFNAVLGLDSNLTYNVSELNLILDAYSLSSPRIFYIPSVVSFDLFAIQDSNITQNVGSTIYLDNHNSNTDLNLFFENTNFVSDVNGGVYNAIYFKPVYSDLYISGLNVSANDLSKDSRLLYFNGNTGANNWNSVDISDVNANVNTVINVASSSSGLFNYITNFNIYDSDLNYYDKLFIWNDINHYYDANINIYNNNLRKMGPSEYDINFLFDLDSVDLNTSQTSATNIIGGPNIGGNYWTNATSTGLSDTCTDNGDGFCTIDKTITDGTHTYYDYLPLTEYSAITVSSCMNIYDANTVGDILLDSNIAGFDGNCFVLQEPITNPLTINCNNNFIDINTNSSSLLSTNGFDVNSITFENCDINNYATGSFIFYLNSDINTLNVLTSNIYSSDGNFVLASGLTNNSFDFIFTDSYFEFSNLAQFLANSLDLNRLTISDLNLEMNTTNLFMSASSFNYFSLLDSVINQTGESLSLINVGASDTNNLDLNLSGTYIYSDSTNSVISFADGNNYNINIYDLNIEKYTNDGNGSVMDLQNLVNPSSISFSNSDVSLSTYLFNFVGSYFENIDLNFSGLTIDTNYLALFLTSKNTTYNISDLDVNISYLFQASSDYNVTIIDSNLNIDLLMSNANSNVFGSIYNNIITDWNYDNNFIILEGVSTLDLDFNSSLSTNATKRIQLGLNDDSSSIGGNIWFDTEGNNLCLNDSVEPYGICDSNIELIGSDQNYYDYLALVEYIIPSTRVTSCPGTLTDVNLGQIIYLDLNVTNVSNCIDLSGINADTNWLTIDCNNNYIIGTFNQALRFIDLNSTILSTITIQNCNFYTSGSSHILNVVDYLDSNVNTINFIDNNVNLNETMNMSHDSIISFRDINIDSVNLDFDGSTIYANTSYANIVEFDTSDYNFYLNTLNISNLNATITNSSDISDRAIIYIGAGMKVFDINNINILDSDINSREWLFSSYLAYWDNKDSSLDFNFYNSNIDLYSSGFKVNNLGLPELNIYDLNATVHNNYNLLYLTNGGSSMNAIDFNTIKFENSDLTFNSGSLANFAVTLSGSENYLDFNIVNSDINLVGANNSNDITTSYSYITNFIFESYDSNIYGLDINSLEASNTTNMFAFNNSIISDLSLFDSNIFADNLFGIVDSTVDTLVYNNKIYDSNTDNNFILLSGTNTLTMDFNTTQQLSTNIVGKRYKGGNYWTNTDANGYSDLCGSDWNNVANDNDRDGICNTSYTVLQSDVNYTDYLPLDIPANICGLVTGDITLSDDVDGWTGTCFSLSDSLENLTINCNGYTLRSSIDYAKFIDINADLNSLTIQNCNLDFDTGMDKSIIYSSNTTNKDLNYISILDSNLPLTRGSKLFYLYYSNTNPLTKDFLYFDFSDSNIYRYDDSHPAANDLIYIGSTMAEPSTINTITISNADVYYFGGTTNKAFFKTEYLVNTEFNMFDSNILQYKNNLFTFVPSGTPDLDINFSGSEINVMDSSNNDDSIFSFSYAVNNVRFNNLFVNATSSSINDSGIEAMIEFNYDVNSFSIIDGNILYNNANNGERPRALFYIGSSGTNTYNLDVNFFNSNIELYGDTSITNTYNNTNTSLNYLNFVGDTIIEQTQGARSFYFEYDDSNFTVNNLNVISSDSNSTLIQTRLAASDTNVNYYMSDSNIQIGRLFNLASSESFPSKLSGLIYNNSIDTNADWNNYMDVNGVVTLDLNTEFQEGTNILDNNYIGGNYWLDQNCQDINTTTLICNESYNLHFNNSSYDINDYLPLAEQTHNIDVGVSYLEYLNNIIYDDIISVGVTVYNYGDINTNAYDFNIVFYYANVGGPTGTTFDTENFNYVLEPSGVRYVFGTFDVNTIDFNYCCAKIVSIYDTNSSNDYYCAEADVLYRDLNASTITASNAIYGSSVDVNVLVQNAGDYNSQDYNVNLYLYDSGDHTTYVLKQWTLQDINASTSTTLTYTWDANIIGMIDVNFVIISNETDYNLTNNYLYTASKFTITYVDLNATIGTISDVNAGHSRDVNCTIYNIGNANATGDYNVYLKVNGTTVDSNTDLSSLNASANHVETLTWTPTAKADDYNVGCFVTYSGTDYNTNNNSQYTTKSVGSDSEVDLSVTDISLSSTVAGVVTITCDINNIGDENTASDYNVKMYVDDVLLSSSDLNTQINVNVETSTTFSWTSTAGTHTLECVADYNVNNYEGYDQNLDNNSYSESFTITSGTAPAGGGGGGGSSATTEVTKDITIDANKGTASFSNSDNDGVDKVIINYNDDITDALTLKLNTEPELTSSDFKVILDNTVIYYLQFTYSGDQTELQNATIMFSLPKSKVTNKDLIRLGRLNNGIWTYYVPTVEDKGTYYQFTVEVPGFSYFAIVSFKETTKTDNSDTNTNVNTNTTNNNNNNNDVVTDDNKTTTEIHSGTDVKTDDTKGSTESSSNNSVTFWIIGSVIIIAGLVWAILHFFHKPKNVVYSFKQ